MRAITKKQIRQRLKKISLLGDAQILVIGVDNLVEGLSLERIERMETLVRMCLERKIDDSTQIELKKCLVDIGRLYQRDSDYHKIPSPIGRNWMNVNKVLQKAEFEINWGVL